MISIIISRSRYYNLIEKSGRRALKNLEGKRQDITSSEASFLKRYTLYLFKKRESCFCKFTTTIRDNSRFGIGQDLRFVAFEDSKHSAE